MKITDPDVIKTGEKDLIEAVKEDLDLDVIKQILKKRIAETKLSAKGGEIVVHNNDIAFRLDFDLNLSGSLMFDRQGSYISEGDDADTSDEFDSVQPFEEVDTGQENQSPDPLAPDDLAVDHAGDTDDLEDDDLNIDLPDYGDEDTDIENEEAGLHGDLPEAETDDMAGNGIDPMDDPAVETDSKAPHDTGLELEPDLEDAFDSSFDPDLKDELPDLENELKDEIETESDPGIEEELPDASGPDIEDEMDFDPEEAGDAQPEADDNIEDNIVDEDINDILKESRDFWEQKKDS